MREVKQIFAISYPSHHSNIFIIIVVSFDFYLFISFFIFFTELISVFKKANTVTKILN